MTAGVVMALIAALLFAISIPASKLLLSQLTTFQLAGLLYLGGGLGVAPALLKAGIRQATWPSDRTNRGRVLIVLTVGGLAAPVLFLAGLRLSAAGSASLILSLELAATALLGTLFFRDHLTRTGVLGVVGIVVATALVSFPGGWPGIRSAVLITAACLCWGLDNQVTALIDGVKPTTLAFWKGTVAGAANLILGLLAAPWRASGGTALAGLCIGALSYGLSITLYVASAQQLGATRAQMLFATVPFLGAVLSFLVLGETLSLSHLAALAVLVPSVIALLVPRHVHEHRHEATWHIHSHRHDDDFHAHQHPAPQSRARHTHWHRHEPVVHEHQHEPDLHHRHDHSINGSRTGGTGS
jgi:drug/metabolite transporter (DMT)-like permease